MSIKQMLLAGARVLREFAFARLAEPGVRAGERLASKQVARSRFARR